MGLDMYLSTKDGSRVGYWRKANAIHAWFVKHVQDDVDECQPSPVTRAHLEQLRLACKQVLDSVETVDGQVDAGTEFTKDAARKLTTPGRVIVNAKMAERVLPTQGGFFFGSTEYSEWYLRDLTHTVEVVDAALAMPADTEFEYQASW